MPSLGSPLGRKTSDHGRIRFCNPKISGFPLTSTCLNRHAGVYFFCSLQFCRGVHSASLNFRSEERRLEERGSYIAIIENARNSRVTTWQLSTHIWVLELFSNSALRCLPLTTKTAMHKPCAWNCGYMPFLLLFFRVGCSVLQPIQFPPTGLNLPNQVVQSRAIFFFRQKNTSTLTF